LPRADGADLAVGSIPCDIAPGGSQYNRFSRAFSKLSLKNFNCLNVPEAERCLTEEDVVSCILDGVETARSGVPLLQRDVVLDHGPTDSRIQQPEVFEDIPNDGCTPSPGLGCREQPKILVQDVVHVSVGPEEDRLGVFKFLIRHMLKRNPFFQIQNISFVVCEPIGCDEAMKQAFTELLLCDLKVPG